MGKQRERRGVSFYGVVLALVILGLVIWIGVLQRKLQNCNAAGETVRGFIKPATDSIAKLNTLVVTLKASKERDSLELLSLRPTYADGSDPVPESHSPSKCTEWGGPHSSICIKVSKR